MPRALDTAERLTRVEATLVSLQTDLSALRGALGRIDDAIGRSHQTNWPLVFSGVFLTMAVYGAAIRPLEQKVDQQQIVVEKRGELLNAVQLELAKSVLDRQMLRGELDDIRTHGSTSADRRLAILEFKAGIVGK